MINRKRIGCLFGLVLLCLCACSHNTDIYLEEYGENTLTVEDTETESGVPESEEDGKAEDAICYVYICGAVMQPGVYAMPEGSRIFEVIREAGGLTEEADDTFVNQAELVTDGMMIRIYTTEEAKSLEAGTVSTTAGGTQNDGRIDINMASAAELMALPGIGSAKAEAIVTYREENGAFSCIEDLMNIPGIKEGIFRQLKEHIKVNK